MRIAREKAQAAATALGARATRPLLAADTAVVLGDRIFGKPVDEAHGVAMLMALGGRTHEVLTAVVASTGGRVQGVLQQSRVTFRALEADECRRYWATGEPAGKAGAYAIQGQAAVFIERLEGSFSGVMGLPLFETSAPARCRRRPALAGRGMSVEILVNVTPRECRAALIQQGVVQELYVERANRRGFAGNIYRGRVNRVLPGMQAAFVDIGLERAAFLHAADIAPDAEIGALVNEGDLLLVQVRKDPIGTKGARLTTDVSLPSRFLVHLPRGSGIGVSARIEEGAERLRLRDGDREQTPASSGRMDPEDRGRRRGCRGLARRPGISRAAVGP